MSAARGPRSASLQACEAPSCWLLLALVGIAAIGLPYIQTEGSIGKQIGAPPASSFTNFAIECFMRCPGARAGRHKERRPDSLLAGWLAGSDRGLRPPFNA